MFDWVNQFAASTTVSAKGVGATLVIVFIVYHAIASKMTIARIIVAAITGGIVIAILFGGIDFIAGLVAGELQ